MKAPTTFKPLADMTNSERFAYFKATAPAEDLAFFLRTAEMSQSLRDRAKLLTGLVGPKIRKALPLIYAAWRTERNAMDRIQTVPAVGSNTEYYGPADTRPMTMLGATPIDLDWNELHTRGARRRLTEERKTA